MTPDQWVGIIGVGALGAAGLFAFAMTRRAARRLPPPPADEPLKPLRFSALPPQPIGGLREDAARRRPQQSDPVPMPIRWASATPPKTPDDLIIDYVSGEGELTERRITIRDVAIFPHGAIITAWCHLRQGERTFRSSGIDNPRRVSGEPVDLTSELPKIAERLKPKEEPKGTSTMPLTDVLAKIANPSGRMATPRQLEALHRIGMVSGFADVTFEQAGTMLSAKAYAEGAIHSLIKATDGYPGEKTIEALLMLMIIQDDELRERATSWNARRLARGTTNATPMPKRDEHFAKVQAAARHLLRQHAGWTG